MKLFSGVGFRAIWFICGISALTGCPKSGAPQGGQEESAKKDDRVDLKKEEVPQGCYCDDTHCYCQNMAKNLKCDKPKEEAGPSSACAAYQKGESNADGFTVLDEAGTGVLPESARQINNCICTAQKCVCRPAESAGVVSVVQQAVHGCESAGALEASCLSHLSPEQVCFVLPAQSRAECAQLLGTLAGSRVAAGISDADSRQVQATLRMLDQKTNQAFVIVSFLIAECSGNLDCIHQKLGVMKAQGNLGLLPALGHSNESDRPVAAVTQDFSGPNSGAIIDEILKALGPDGLHKVMAQLQGEKPEATKIYWILVRALSPGAPPQIPAATPEVQQKAEQPQISGSCHLKPGVCEYHHRTIESQEAFQGGFTYNAHRSAQCMGVTVAGVQICEWSLGWTGYWCLPLERSDNLCRSATRSECGQGGYESCQWID